MSDAAAAAMAAVTRAMSIPADELEAATAQVEHILLADAVVEQWLNDRQ